MPTEELPEREHESLGGRVLRHIGRLLNDMKALKMYPHRMGRIAQPAVSERICCEQVAKLVVHMGLSYRCKQRYASTPSQGQQPHQSRRQPPPGRELAEAALCYGQPSEVPSLHHA